MELGKTQHIANVVDMGNVSEIAANALGQTAVEAEATETVHA